MTENENAQLELTNAHKNLVDAQEQLSLLLAEASQAERVQASAGIDQAKAALASASATRQQGLASKAQAQATYEDAVAAYEQSSLSLQKATLTSPITGVVIEKKIADGSWAQAYGLVAVVPFNLFPESDQADATIGVTMPEGTSLQATNQVINEIGSWVQKQPETERLSATVAGEHLRCTVM